MHPAPRTGPLLYPPGGKLLDQVALITGGDSGIGRAVAVAFAHEGADIAIVYLEEHRDAEHTRKLIEQAGRRCILIAGDIGHEEFCREAVRQCIGELGGLNILVNNAAEQHPLDRLEDMPPGQLERTFQTNIFSFFYMTKAALKHLGEGDCIINTSSVTAYRGNPKLLDYSSTKGAIVSFTRSLSIALADRKIRVNGVAPGPIWTPLIPSTFPADKVEKFGADVPMKRVGEPEEVAPAYVFLASRDASYMTGQMLHPNGGEPVGS